VKVTRYGEAGFEIHKRPAGTVMTVLFELEGQSFTALNGGPIFKFSEAISLQVTCGTQKEADYYWEKLTAGGDPAAQQCGWLKDKFGLSWQVIPKAALELLSEPKSKKSQRAFSAMMEMKKLDLAALKRAYDGKA
jgi:predicted 3-demethylubiquinone-9 3-methyltransferase (glyoxalase superfamily)